MTCHKKTTFRGLLNKRAGLSLIEVLIGLTVTLIVLGAMAGAFRFASEEMAKGRASLELTNRLRTTENLLRDDLRRLTVELKPYHRLPASPQGYAEIIDGPEVDARNIADDSGTPARNESVANLLVGDFDDIFAGTIRSTGKPFRGRFDPDAGVIPVPTPPTPPTIQQSHLAEVVWFTTFSDFDSDGTIEPDQGEGIRLYRRQLIIKPSLSPLLPGNLTAWQVNQFIQRNDISVRVEPDLANAGRFRVVANSLQELSFRGNRFAHVQGTYPQQSFMSAAWLRNDVQYEDARTPQPVADFNGDGNTDALDLFPHRRASDQSDLILSDVAAFDIRVFAIDALSLVKWDPTLPDATRPIVDMVLPSDIGWQIAAETSNMPASSFNSNYFYGQGGTSFVSEAAANEVVVRVSRVGAYVDLGKGVVTNPHLYALTQPPIADPDSPRLQGFQLPPAVTPRVGTGSGILRQPLSYLEHVFDTGTSAYEGSNLIGVYPAGTNGIDDPDENGTPNGIIDEDEKLNPPYDRPIRGIQITVRLYEPNSSQATQMTLKHSTVAE